MIQKRNPALDGVRGLAIIAVLISHALDLGIFRAQITEQGFVVPLHLGWSGVDLFFVLSGFLITGILLATKDAANRASSFYVKRALRILPIYYATILAVLFAQGHSSWVRATLHFTDWKDYAAYLTYFQNWLSVWHGGFFQSSLIAHFWSLGVEEQFYFLWPWIVWLVPTRLLPKLCVIGLVGTLGLRILLTMHYGPSLATFALTPTRGDGLLVGAAIAAWSFLGQPISKRACLIAGAIGTAVIAWIGFHRVSEFFNAYTGWWMCTIGFTALAVIYGSLVGLAQYRIPLFSRFFEQNIMRSFGKYSYGIYVYHPLLYLGLAYLLEKFFGIHTPYRLRYALLYFVVAIALSYAVAFLSFSLFEERFLKLKQRFEPESSASTIPAKHTGSDTWIHAPGSK